MSNEKIVFADEAIRVEDRDGIQVCVFITETGKEVLYHRAKNDAIVKKFDGSLEALDDIRCRAIAAKLLEKKILDRGPQHTSKKVVLPPPTQTAGPKSAPAATGWRPSAADKWWAEGHDRKMNPRERED